MHQDNVIHLLGLLPHFCIFNFFVFDCRGCGFTTAIIESIATNEISKSNFLAILLIINISLQIVCNLCSIIFSAFTT